MIEPGPESEQLASDLPPKVESNELTSPAVDAGMRPEAGAIEMTNEQIEKLLLPRDKFMAGEEQKVDKYWTEVFRGGDNQQLTYFAAQHVHDPQSPMFAAIDAQWQRFTSEVTRPSAVVLHEGNFPVLTTKEQTILNGGESGYVRWLAEQAGVATVWPEPSRDQEFAWLQKQYSGDQIVSFYALRYAHQWHRLDPGHRPSIEEYLDQAIPRYAGQLGSKIGSADDLRRLSPEVVGEQIYFDRRDSLARLISPTSDALPLNNLAWDLGRLRDITIVKNIFQQWQQNKSLFMSYGNSHLLRQKPAIEALLKAKSGQ
jgi:hypothetical protein